MDIRTEVQQQIDRLVGEDLWSLRRAGGMLCLMFGKRRMVITRRGVEREVGEYSLHIQCAWRLTCEGTLVIAPVDLFTPVDSDEPAETEFDWEKGNRFDQKAALLFSPERPQLRVLAATAGNAGSISLALEAGYQLEVFPDKHSECWRLFDFDDEASPHFVVTGKGIEGPDPDDVPA